MFSNPKENIIVKIWRRFYVHGQDLFQMDEKESDEKIRRYERIFA